jgi:hypothetical protein
MSQEDCTQTANDVIPHVPKHLPAGLPDAELLRYVELITEALAVPSCRVCGGLLSVVRIGGGKSTEWACPAASRDSREATHMDARRVADAHYRNSHWVQYREEHSYVRELAERFRKLSPTLPADSIVVTNSHD